MNVRLKL